MGELWKGVRPDPSTSDESDAMLSYCGSAPSTQDWRVIRQERTEVSCRLALILLKKEYLGYLGDAKGR